MLKEAVTVFTVVVDEKFASLPGLSPVLVLRSLRGISNSACCAASVIGYTEPEPESTSEILSCVHCLRGGFSGDSWDGERGVRSTSDGFALSGVRAGGCGLWSVLHWGTSASVRDLFSETG